MKIYLYLKDFIKIFYLPESVSGSFSFDVDDERVEKLINIDAKDGKWYFFATGDCKVVNDSTYVDEILLEPYKFYVINREDTNYLIYTAPSNEVSYNSYNILNGLNISIGGDNPTAFYNCPYVDNYNFRINKVENDKVVLTKTNANIYINKRALKRDSYVLNNGDEIYFYGVKILFLGNMLMLFANDNIFRIDFQSARLQQVALNNPMKEENVEVKDKPLYTDEDYFSKSPRLRRVVEEKEIEMSQPPNPSTSTEMPFILTVAPMLTMAVTSITMLSVNISKIASGESDIGSSLPQLVSAGAMLLSSLLWPVLTKIYNKKVKMKNEQKKEEAYNKYLARKEEELIAESKLQAEIIRENVISIDTCLENLKHHNLNFWDKRTDQNDFLVARIGVGDEKLKVKLKETKDEFTVEEDDLKKKFEELLEKYKYIKNVPIGYSFYENYITAVMGESEKSHDFVNNVLFQLLTFYSYDELKIVVFTNDKYVEKWEYIKYLNHNMTNDNNFRFFASNEENASYVIDYLKQDLNFRKDGVDNHKDDDPYKPYYLIVIDDLDIIKTNNIIEELSEVKENIGFSAIILENKLSKLPSLCNNFINLSDNMSGVLKNSYEEQEQQLFKDEINPNINMMEAARILANIPVDISSDDNEGSLPDSINFLEMEKVGKVEQLNILNRWNTNDSTVNLKAEVGVDPDGKLMYLDLHEKAHGPHGLIAGMTGSGKSEFIITWILSLCMNFSPDDVAFILIDYKGGGLAFAFENQTTGVRLPHLAGTITNLDKSEIDRSLVSIDSEVKRRQQLFNEARDKLGESTIDIYKYQSFYHEGKLNEPLPHLFIVCDEFAELKDQQPGFMDNLISIARIGRSLGVHLILATQKPSGVVNAQIWSNSKFKVCLKVQDASDSQEMLKKPDAASLKQAGRFYLQVGYDEYYALGQSGWCGAKYYPADVVQKTIDKSVNILDEVGGSIKNIQAGSSKSTQSEAQGEQLAAIMNEIISISEKKNSFSRRLWLENIPDVITVDDTIKKYNFVRKENEYKLLLGEYDFPESQIQEPLIYDFLTDGNTILVSNNSEDNELMYNSMLYNILKYYKPSEINYYILDFGSQNFVKHKKSPFCGGVVTPSDTEEYHNLFEMISEEKKKRKKILSDFGGDYSDYIKQYPGKMPIMFFSFVSYESVSDSDKSLYDNIGEVVRDSDRYGIVFVFLVNQFNSVPMRCRHLIKTTYAFKLKEASDYSYIYGIKQKKTPKDVLGRGICKDGENLHEFQTACICNDKVEENNIYVNLFEELSKKYTDKILKIPSLPEQILLDDVSSKLKDLKHIPIGMESDTLKIKTLDLTLEGAKIIMASKQKKLYCMLESIVDELLYLKTNIIIIDSFGELSDINSKVKNYFSTNFDEKVDKVIEFVEKNTSVDTVIIINSLSRLISNLSQSSKIEDLFKKCLNNEKNNVLIFDEVSKIKAFNFENWFKMIDSSEGLFIGTGADSQNIYKTSSYYRDISKTYPLNYGFYFYDNSYKLIKLIEFKKIEDGDEDDD